MSEFREGDIVAIECKVASVGIGSDELRLLPKTGPAIYAQASVLTLVRAEFQAGDEVRMAQGTRKGVLHAHSGSHAWVEFKSTDGVPDFRTVSLDHLLRWDGVDLGADPSAVNGGPEPEELAGGWIAWPGGDCPVPTDARVEVRLRDRYVFDGKAGSLAWDRAGGVSGIRTTDGEIVAYRLLPAEPGPSWIEWDGGGPCPVNGETMVRVRTRSGGGCRARAKTLRWSHAERGTTASSDIVAYAVAPEA